MGGKASVGEDFQEKHFFLLSQLNFDLPEKNPSEMEVAPRYALLKLLTLLGTLSFTF